MSVREKVKKGVEGRLKGYCLEVGQNGRSCNCFWPETRRGGWTQGWSELRVWTSWGGREGRREWEMSNERNGTPGQYVNSYGTPVATDEIRE